MTIFQNTGEIHSLIMSNYDNVYSVDVIECDGKYIVGIVSTPFFKLSDKNTFIEEVKTAIGEKVHINKYDILITFNLDTIYQIKHAKTHEDMQYILNKVSKEIK